MSELDGFEPSDIDVSVAGFRDFLNDPVARGILVQAEEGVRARTTDMGESIDHAFTTNEVAFVSRALKAELEKDETTRGCSAATAIFSHEGEPLLKMTTSFEEGSKDASVVYLDPTNRWLATNHTMLRARIDDQGEKNVEPPTSEELFDFRLQFSHAARTADRIIARGYVQ